MPLIPFTDFARTVLGLKLTAGQLAYARVAFDGVDPVDLDGPERALAFQMFANVARIPRAARRQMVMRFGRTSGKSLLCAAYGVYRLMTADLSGCGPGAKPAVVVVSFRLDQAGIILNTAKALVQGSAQLKGTIVRQVSDELELQRWDGKRVWFQTVPKSAGGAAGRGFDIIALILDESEFIGSKASTAVITDKDVIGGAMPRLLADGPLILASTPWPAASETAKLFDANFGNPQTAMCAKAPTLLVRDNNPAIADIIALERIRDPRNALREYDCEIVDSDGLFFEVSTIDACAKAPVFAQKTKGTAGIDLAFRGDSSALVIIERQGDTIAVVHLDMMHPTTAKPLVPSEVMNRFSEAAKSFNCREFAADGHGIDTAREIAHTHGLQVTRGPVGTAQIVKTYTYMRSLLREGKLKLPADTRLLSQLKSVQSAAQAGGGLSIVLPKLQGMGHCDLVPALIAAIHHDLRYGRLTNMDLNEKIKGPPVTSGSPFLTSGGFQRW